MATEQVWPYHQSWPVPTPVPLDLDREIRRLVKAILAEERERDGSYGSWDT